MEYWSRRADGLADLPDPGKVEPTPEERELAARFKAGAPGVTVVHLVALIHKGRGIPLLASRALAERWTRISLA